MPGPSVYTTDLPSTAGDLGNGGGSGGAPTTATYITATSDSGLSAERVLTDTTSVGWDSSTSGQMKANVSTEFVQDTVAAFMTQGANIALTYDDTANTLTVAASGLMKIPAVTTAYTADGALSTSDRVALVNSASTLNMTLGSGTFDGQPYTIKRYGSGTVNVTLHLDGSSGAVITADSGTIKESISLAWDATRSTWLAV